MGAPSLSAAAADDSVGSTTPVLQFPAAACGLPSSTPPRAINQDGLPQFSLALGDVASALFHRGSRSSALREPPEPQVDEGRSLSALSPASPTVGVNDSCCADAAFPNAPGISRVIVSTMIAAPNSPPLNTKSPTEISRSARYSLTRSSTPS